MIDCASQEVNVSKFVVWFFVDFIFEGNFEILSIYSVDLCADLCIKQISISLSYMDDF